MKFDRTGFQEFELIIKSSHDSLIVPFNSNDYTDAIYIVNAHFGKGYASWLATNLVHGHLSLPYVYLELNDDGNINKELSISFK